MSSHSKTPADGAPLTTSMVSDLLQTPIQDLTLYRRALTHRSMLRSRNREANESNERLEFLGDALLDLIVGELLYHRFADRNEGFLTRLRAKLVSGKVLAEYARRIDLGDYLLMSKNAAKGEGRDNQSILADAFEAIVGALYLEQGYEAARTFVRDEVLDGIDLLEVAEQEENYKSLLLERMQADGRPQPTYRVIQEEGPSHDKTFTVEALVDDTAYGQGQAGSKKQAEQQAAREALKTINNSS
ncbi:ribonuclease III [Longibacter salinarum]|uniref:Ribonuclease 3 n=1 Tax=Longibacter salinarum TaxID=1850348 RepID=A0A2A8D035_9BACT|nr:ribonuclease III [Longibacter salinarum]PEN14295.1 ribonuclease III [Longibacter salinarum]